MKKLLLLICCLSFGIAKAQTWYGLGNPGFTPANVDDASMAVDKNGVHYVAFVEQNKLSVMKYNDTTWVYVGPSRFYSYYPITNLRLVLDSNGTPYVGFEAYGSIIKKFDGSAWVNVGPAIGYIGQTGTKLAMGKNNEPYVAFKRSGFISVLKFNDTSWVSVGSQYVSTDTASGPVDLEIDTAGVPYISFLSSAFQGTKGCVMKFDGTSWTYVGAPNFTPRAQSFNMALDVSGTPYVVYVDLIIPGGFNYVKKFDGTSWVNVGNSSSGVGAATIQARYGSPYIENGDDLRRFNGIGWSGYSLYVLSGSTAFAFTIDSNDLPAVVYTDVNMSNKLRAWHYGVFPCRGWVTPSGTTNLCTGQNVTLSATYNFNYQWSNGYTMQNYTTIFPGVYTVTMTNNAAGCTVISTPITVTVNPIPAVSFSLPDSVCGSLTPMILNGLPAGGSYTTPLGVLPGNFYLTAAAPVGPNIISYQYTDSNNCSKSVIDTTVVHICIDTLCEASFTIYPDSGNQGIYIGYNQSVGNNLSYFWSFGDGDTSTLQYPSHTYASPGQYYVCLTVVGDSSCINSYCDSSFYVFKTEGGLMSELHILDHNAPVAIKDLTENFRISVYPNPATNQLNVALGNMQAEQVNIYNVDGKLLIETKQLANNTIDISGLAKGVYVMEIKVKDAVQRVRWVKM